MKNFLESLEKGTAKGGACSLALTGISSNSLALYASRKNPTTSWILDSRATDHMTPFSHHFTTYSICSSSQKITLADGSLTTIAGQGDVIQ